MNIKCILIDLYGSADIEKGSLNRVIELFHAVRSTEYGERYDMAGWNTPARLYILEENIPMVTDLCKDYNLIVIDVIGEQVANRRFMFA